MALYSWNPACMGGVFALPNEVADRLLTVASAEQMRVLLWFSRHGGWDSSACAAALGLTTDECEGCLRFWAEQGVLVSDGAAPTPVAPATEPKSAPVPPRLSRAGTRCWPISRSIASLPPF